MTTTHDNKVRKAEIKLALATIKDDFFSKGIKTPRSVQTKLELELAKLNLQEINRERAATSALFQLRTRHYELIRQKLHEFGLPNLWDDCLDLARLQLNPTETPSQSPQGTQNV